MAILAFNSNQARATAEAQEALAQAAQRDAEKASADLKSTLEEVFGLLLSGVSSSEELASNTLLTIADPMPTSQALLLHSL
jgi:hypothetical protein